MRKIAIAMAKGGVGKTTTAVNLSYQLAQKGKRVLLIDCDTQNQAAAFLGVTPKYGLYEFITGSDPKGEPVDKNDTLHAARKNLWLLSGGMNLSYLKNWIYESPDDERQTVLPKRLNPREDSLDFIIFDCAPGWDVLSVNILCAAKEILCPVTLEGAAISGLKTYIGYIASAQQINKDLEIKYILPTIFDRRTRQARDVLDQLHKVFGDKVCKPININVRVSEAPAFGQTVFEYSPRATGSSDYNELAKRILKNGSK